MIGYKEKSISPEKAVRAMYRALLGREADADGLKLNIDFLEEHGLARALKAFVTSPEFLDKNFSGIPQSYFHLNYDTSMQVQAEANEDQIEKIWKHVEATWSELGSSEPLWSVLTGSEYHSSSNPSAEVIDRFYASGQHDLAYIEAFLSRAGLGGRRFTSAVEYGCGVGRMSAWLAPKVDRLQCLDISAPHLAMARERLQKHDVTNAECVLVTSRSDVQKLSDIDFFLSIIVLQHNPPPVIADILNCAFRALRQGGIALFQVPVYAKGYHFDAASYLAPGREQQMEMHVLPQEDVFRLAAAQGLYPLEVRNDHWTGMYDSWISSTFLLQKKSA